MRFSPLALAVLVLVGCQKQPANSDETTIIAPATVDAPAAPAQGTLQKINESGAIVLAYRDAAIPFSYIADNQKQPMGYAHDLSLKVVNAIKAKLGKDISVHYHLVTAQTRIAFVQDGTVDLECGSTSNTEERQQQVDFSVGYFETGTRLLTAVDSGIQDFADLKGKTLVTEAGSTAERYIREYNDKNQLGINIISAKDHDEAFLILESGRADVYMMDDILLVADTFKTKDPKKWHIVGTSPSSEIYGCMLRKGDTEFKALIDDTLKTVYASGEINAIYNKWFTQPIPPKQINLNFAMSDGIKALFSDPHDGAKPKGAMALVAGVATDATKAVASVAADAKKEAAATVSDAAKTAEAVVADVAGATATR